MNLNEEFLMSKMNELEMKIFDLEKRVRLLENMISSQDKTQIQQVAENTNTRIEKYSFDGNIYKKSRLVLAVITEYVKKHPGISESELEQAFPGSAFKLTTYGCVRNVDLISPNYKDGPVKRYYIDEAIVLNDGTKMAVCNQWGGNIKLFIDYVKSEHGIEIDPVNQ